MPKSVDWSRNRCLWIALFVGATLVLLTAGYGYYTYETERIRQEKYQDLATIARLKADQIVQWRKERISDVRIFANAPLFRKALRDWLRDPNNTERQRELHNRCVLEQGTSGYADVVLVDLHGRILLSASLDQEPLSPTEKLTIDESLTKGSAILSELYRSPQGIVRMDSVSPILDQAGQPIAVVAMRGNADILLYPLIQSWPTFSRTSETLLVRREGDEILFLNDLRHRPDTALSLREPLTRTDIPAVQAVLGKQGIFHGKDYRGVEVLTDLRPIPDSPWFMVAKVDASDILAEARYRGGVTAIFAALFILLAAGVTAYGYRYRQAHLYRELYRSEREQMAALGEFRTTLYSIGDAVITTDAEGLVKQMNQVAERLTGWPEEEARGKRLDEVFHILNEDSRAVAENPVWRVLKEGLVIGLANHTVLIGKDGTEHPIADSGAPIRDESGAIIGVVLVFRDQTQERAVQKTLRESEEKYRFLVEESFDGLFLTRGTKIGFTNSRLREMLGYEEGELEGKDHWVVYHPDYHAIVRSRAQARLRGEPVANRYELKLQRKDGSSFDCELVAKKVDVGGEPGIQAWFRDITERKNSERAMQENLTFLQTLLDAIPNPVYYKDTDGTYLGCNRAFETYWGLSKEGIVGRSVYDLAPTDLADIYWQKDRELLERPGIQTYETSAQHAGGSRHDVVLHKATFFSSDGSLAGLIGVIVDITDRKRAEKALSESEERYRTVADFTYDWEYWVHPEGRLLYVSPSCERVTGYSAREFLDDHSLMERIVHPDDLAEVMKHFHVARKVDHETSYRLDFRIIHRDGQTRWISHACQAVYGKDGQSLGRRASNRDITERKQAQEALRQSEEQYRAVFDNAGIGIDLLDRHGRIVKVNQALLNILGYAEEELSQRTFLDITYPDDREISKRNLETLIAGEIDSYRLVKRYVRKDGSIIWVDLWSSAIRAANGDNEGTVAVIEDITDRKQAEEALRESERKFRLVTETIQDVFWIITPDISQIVYISPGYEKIWGRTIESLYESPHSFLDSVHHDDREQFTSILQKHHSNGTEYTCEYRIVRPDDSIRWILARGFPIYDDQGILTLMCGVSTDITERKQVQEALEESEEWYRSVVEESFDGIFVQKGPKIVFANSRLYEMLGYSAGELEGQEHWLIYHPDYRAITSERAVARMRGDDIVPHYEVKLQRKDGTSFDGEISARAVTVRGEPGVQVWLRDISYRKRSELALRRLATAVEQAEEAIVITDPSGTIQYVNPAFEKITGYTRDEALGNNPSILKGGQHGEEFYRDLWNSITHGKVWKGRFINRRKDGTFYSEDSTISPVRDPKGRILNFVAVKRDVTEGLALQQQLLQAQKMEAIGTLAGGIAHDFNNLLTVVMGFSELLLAEKKPKDWDYADLQKIFHAAKNGGELVQRLLMFSRKSEPKPVSMNLNKQIVEVEKLLRRTIPKMIDIHLDLSPDLPAINADPSQIEQILMNLAVNARDSMPDKGKLTVITEIVTLDEEYCRLHVEATSGEHVLLSVSDTGHGMDRETAEHIFEPFFTTKEMGRGTGLGLAMVYGIVKQHNGHISVYSEVGKGTTFRVYLPAMPADVEPDVEASGIMPAFGTETVLLVDDEDFVRELGARILTKHGYTVLQATNGREALDLFKKESSQISLVILDLIMPEMGGTECLKKLLKIDPQVKVLVASGYSADASVKKMIQIGAKGFVSKPFRVKDLLRGVRKVLDEG